MAEKQPNNIIISGKDAKVRGLLYYFTGKACKRGHIGLRRVRSLNCIECEKIQYKKYCDNNRELVNKRSLERYHKIYKISPEYKKKASQSQKAWRQNNREKYMALLYERVKKWRQNNPDKTTLNWITARHRRRARKKNASGSFTRADILVILKMQNYRCAYCKKNIKKGYVMDHIIPLARGGSNDRKNMQATCAPCNQRKHARDPLDFARSLGMLL